MVEAENGERNESADGGDVDEDTVFVFAEVGDDGFGGFEQTDNIDVVLAADVVHRGGFERATGAVSGVVEEDVDLAEFIDGGLDAAVDGVGVLDVEFGDEDVVELVEFGLFFRRAHGCGDVPALRFEELGGGFADAGGGSGDEDGLAHDIGFYVSVGIGVLAGCDNGKFSWAGG